MKAEKIFAEAAKITQLFTEDRKDRVEHRAFIGESVSRVYLPVYTHNGVLFDGVSHQKLGLEAITRELTAELLAFRQEWEPRYIATLCPGCGDVMQGGRETLVMLCRNCDRQWFEENGSFQHVEYSVLPAHEEPCMYLPFWQIAPEDENGQLATLADFLELTNQPVVIQRAHRERKFRLMIPAFKMNPALFLQIAKMLTVAQQSLSQTRETGLGRQTVYPVTLPHLEAAEAIKTVLVASAVSARRVVEALSVIRFRTYAAKLIYLPFRDAGHDWIEQYTGVCIARAALRYGRKL